MDEFSAICAGYFFRVGGELTFGPCALSRALLLLATAPRETFEGAGTGRKAGTSPQEAIRRGHFFCAGISVPRVRLSADEGRAARPPTRRLCHASGRRSLDRDALLERGGDAGRLHPKGEAGDRGPRFVRGD